MKIKSLWIFILMVVFFVSCDLDNRENNLETLVSYMEKLDRGDLARIIEGSGFKAGIIFKDKEGNYQPLTFRSCYNGFLSAGYDKKFSYQFCKYLLYTALNKVLERRAEQLEPEIKALIEEYKTYLKNKEEALETNKEIALFFIPSFFISAGLVIGMGIRKLMNLKEREKKINEKALEVETKLKLYTQEKEEEARKIVENAKMEASEIIERAKEEAEYIKTKAYEKGYLEVQERHKKELKTLRNRMSAVRNIFKARPELNECFKKIIGWDFEKWLKER